MNTLEKHEKKLYLILLIGFIIYFPIFFNGFVWDDYFFILNNPQVHQLNIPDLFGPSIFNSGPFYRPIPAVYFAFVYSLSGSHAFLYHVLQLALHIVDTSLLFIFFCLFFTDSIALFLALLFLVHPINVESVAFIGSTQSELYFLPGIVALLLAQKKELSRRRMIWITCLLLLATLTKETGFLFLLLVFVYRYLFKRGKLKEFLLSGGLIVVIYTICRLFIGGVKYDEATYIPVVALPLLTRLLNIPAIIIYYLKTFLFPLNLAIWQQWTYTSLSLQNFILPLIISLLLLGLLIFFANHLANKVNRPLPVTQKHQKQYTQMPNASTSLRQLFFFSFWYIIGMGLILQLIPLDMTVADRWFYFPVVGLLGILGVILQLLLPFIRQHYKIYLYGAVVIISLFSLRTFIRTFDYKNNMTLYVHDLQTPADSDNLMLIDQYIIELKNNGNIDEAIQYAEKGVNLKQNTLGTRIVAYDYLGTLYAAKDHNVYRALYAFQNAVALANIASSSDIQHSFVHFVYDNLAQAYLDEKRYNDIIALVNDQTLERTSNDPCLYLHLGIAQYYLGEQQKAHESFSKAYKLSQTSGNVLLTKETMDKICHFTKSP